MKKPKWPGRYHIGRWSLMLALMGASLSGSTSGVNPDANSSPQALRPEIQALLGRCSSAGRAAVAYDPHTQNVGSIWAAPGQAIQQPARLSPTASPEDAARSFLSVCGPLFGLRDESSDLVVNRIAKADAKRSVVRFQQIYEGIPVIAGELITQLDGANNIISVNGEILPDMTKLDTRAAVDAATAEQAALEAVAEEYRTTRDDLAATSPKLWIYNPTLINPAGGSITRLVWRMEVTRKAQQAIRQWILVDAHSGSVVLSLNLLDTARNRMTYTANNTTTRPGTLVCNEANTDCTGGDTHSVNAHIYARNTYDFYWSYHARDSLNNAGMALVSTVHYNTGYCNAFWDGAQMTYGDGCFLVVDDVVAHEMTHGVTDFESNLVYAYESGAINESFSDIWGEFVDLTNGLGNDTAGVRWLMGEDASIGAIRDMMNPPAFGDPDRYLSTLYYHGTGDNGGVHTNSGVGNKAAYLMTDGGTFNGYTVAGIGILKTAKIHYEAQTNILTSGSGWFTLHGALFQACNTLIGTSGITAADCTQVRNATLATEMDHAPGPPSNDDFNDARLVNTSPYTDTVATNAATTAADDPVLACVGSPRYNSVWYRYTPAASGVLDVDTYTSAYDTVLAVFTGSRGSLVSVACNDDASGLQSHVNLAVTAGTTYYIEVASYGAGGGTLNLHASGPPPSSAAGDHNGDGRSDILWRHASRGEVWLWAMNGAAATPTYVRTVADTNWEIRGDGDQNGDGRADILWRNRATGAVYLWLMNGSTVLSQTYVATVDPAYDIVGTGDYNGDGRSDILWRQLTTGDVWIWLMNGATSLSRVFIDRVDPAYAVVGSGDLNGDGRADIVWHHGTAGEVWVWLMNGTTRISQTRVGTVPDVGYKIVGVADHTGDGRADLLWHHATRGEVWIWPMNGTTVVSPAYVNTVPDVRYRIVGTGDYNGDGKADILWRHQTVGDVWVWLMDGTTRLSQTYVGMVPVEGGFDSQFNGSAAGWVGHTGAWSIDSGMWYSAVGIASSWTSASYNGIFSDFEYEATLWRAGCSTCANSVYVRGTPDPLATNGRWNNGYLFTYTTGGDYSVWRVVAGVEINLAPWTQTAAVVQGPAWNTLRVVANGTRLSFFINGTLVWSGTDASLTSGRAGIASYSDSTTGNQIWADRAVLTAGSYVVVYNTLSEEQQRLNEAAQREGGSKSMEQSKK